MSVVLDLRPPIPILVDEVIVVPYQTATSDLYELQVVLKAVECAMAYSDEFPIVVSRDKVLVVGHGTLEDHKRRGVATILATVMPFDVF